MAHALRLQNPNTGSSRIAYEGFSWTCFFFGPFPALFRGDIIGFGAMALSAVLTFGFSGLVWIFAYNAWHRNRLLGHGYEPPHYGGIVLNQNFTLASSEADRVHDAHTRSGEKPFGLLPREPIETRQTIATRSSGRAFGQRSLS